MSCAAMNYDFGQKRNWRRWVWNRIAERVERPHEATCLYLPGVNDFDRPLAVQKGFRLENLIAVERDRSAIAELRSKRVLTIEAEFFDAAFAMCAKRNVDVVYADLCCGLSRDVFVAIHNLMSSYRVSVIAVNLMRGRDASTNKLRAVVDTKHRGELLYASIVAKGIEALDGTRHSHRTTDEHFAHYEKVFMPAFHSYMSESGQVFDTLVMRTLGRFAKPSRERDELMKQLGSAAARPVAAVMAHRTIRAKAARA